jgi:signal transduction histidine kinase/CheY-like chemotaxis protein
MSQSIPESLPPTAVAKMLSATAHIFTSRQTSGLEPALPPSTTSHLAISFSDADEPVYMFIITTTDEHYHFPSSDVNFIRNIGSILLARSVQARVLKADAAKTSFLSAISHELRTPMHAVMQSHALMRQALDSQEYGDLGAVLSLSESSSRTLTNILNDVLDYGKGTAGDHAEEHQRLVSNLAEMTVQIVKMTKVQYLDDSVPVELFVEWEDRDWDVKIDEARFQRYVPFRILSYTFADTSSVLMNGLTNAMKFCRKGSITVRLTSRAHSLVVEVIDTGIGFDEAMMPQVLQAFTKLDKHSAGAGLGLHITKTMLERAGGSLRLKSKVGEGTTFEAILPVSFTGSAKPGGTLQFIRKNIADLSGRPVSPIGHASSPASSGIQDNQPTTPPPPQDDTLSANGSPTLGKESTPTGTPLRVLVVDDNFVCRQLLAKTLRKGRPNVSVQEAEDGVQALKIFGEWLPNLVLTDVCMPNMGGIESAEKMRERENTDAPKSPKSQIYALTALGKTDQRSISMGMNGHASLDGWLVKGEDLTKVVSSIVERMTNQQEDKVEVEETGEASSSPSVSE